MKWCPVLERRFQLEVQKKSFQGTADWLRQRWREEDTKRVSTQWFGYLLSCRAPAVPLDEVQLHLDHLAVSRRKQSRQQRKSAPPNWVLRRVGEYYLRQLYDMELARHSPDLAAHVKGFERARGGSFAVATVAALIAVRTGNVARGRRLAKAAYDLTRRALRRWTTCCARTASIEAGPHPSNGNHVTHQPERDAAVSLADVNRLCGLLVAVSRSVSEGVQVYQDWATSRASFSRRPGLPVQPATWLATNGPAPPRFCGLVPATAAAGAALSTRLCGAGEAAAQEPLLALLRLCRRHADPGTGLHFFVRSRGAWGQPTPPTDAHVHAAMECVAAAGDLDRLLFVYGCRRVQARRTLFRALFKCLACVGTPEAFEAAGREAAFAQRHAMLDAVCRHHLAELAGKCGNDAAAARYSAAILDRGLSLAEELRSAPTRDRAATVPVPALPQLPLDDAISRI
ncbi:hypothetical protein DIPPA_19441 [Diplonema papillatum]|nr:hypothetical protein DIPPA_19441 [Diplonema papillatum]